MDSLLQIAAAAAARYGIADCGICPISSLSQLLPGRKAALVPQRGSVIVLLLPYYTGGWSRRNVALYAVPDDYHRIAGAILHDVAHVLHDAFPDGSFTAFVDSSPIPEVEAAVLCGLGFRGKNGQLINERYGSMMFIGEIVTDIETLEYSKPPHLDGCGDCRRCIDACPTGALGEAGTDMTRCRSAITQRKGELTQWEREQIKSGGLVWGCDICTLACPIGGSRQNTTVAGLMDNLTPTVTVDALDELLTAKSYGWRGRAVVGRNLTIVNG